jgi:hypothetical protein
MKKLFFSILILSSTAYTEDIYDRINECDKRTDRECMMALIRELAQERHRYAPSAESSSDKKDDQSKISYEKNMDCKVDYVSLNGNRIIQISNGQEAMTAPWFDFELGQAQTLTSEWRRLGCDARAKANCTLYSDGSMNLLGTAISSRRVKNARVVYDELRQSICK